MKYFLFSIQILLLALILGSCSNKSAYEAWQRSDQWECQRNPSANCGNRKNYEEYKNERDKIVKKEAPAREIALANQKLLACPHPGEPINWALRYCAFENHTDDEIALQTTQCFINARADLHSKRNACLIKEKYKRLYCKALVEKQRTYESVILCMEDQSIKPFYAGNK